MAVDDYNNLCIMYNGQIKLSIKSCKNDSQRMIKDAQTHISITKHSFFINSL